MHRFFFKRRTQYCDYLGEQLRIISTIFSKWTYLSSFGSLETFHIYTGHLLQNLLTRSESWVIELSQTPPPQLEGIRFWVSRSDSGSLNSPEEAPNNYGRNVSIINAMTSTDADREICRTHAVSFVTIIFPNRFKSITKLFRLATRSLETCGATQVSKCLLRVELTGRFVSL